ncbi:hypothetical protein Lal_00020780 [Lupinus albus]|nr:hypothetical protein Lal_00020780 [Lupinus albus]
MRQSQFSHSTRAIGFFNPINPNPVHIHLPEQINIITGISQIQRRFLLTLIKDPTFSGKDPAKPLHRIDPVTDDSRIKRKRAAIHVDAVAGGGGGGTVVEKDELESAWGEIDEKAKVGKWGSGERREWDGNGVV